LDSGCQPVVAKADGIFANRELVQKGQCKHNGFYPLLQMALEMHQIKKIEPRFAIGIRQG
jgi:hypothetical protein